MRVLSLRALDNGNAEQFVGREGAGSDFGC